MSFVAALVIVVAAAAAIRFRAVRTNSHEFLQQL